MVLAPSGEQVDNGAETSARSSSGWAVGCWSYVIAGSDLIDGYGIGEISTSGRGQVLIPWPNRLQAGSYEFGGRSHQLALDEPSAGNAIHGLVRWAGWRVAEREANRVVVVHTLHPRPGYPFALELSIEYTLSQGGLQVLTRATNVGSDPCPFGSGAHPYLTFGTGSRRFGVPAGPGAHGAALR